MKKFEPLTGDEICDIHLATMRLLEEVGVSVKSEKALRLLVEAGAEVDFEKRVAKIPEWMVMEAVKCAPRSFTLHARNSKHDITMSLDTMATTTSAATTYIIDVETGERRKATREDAVHVAKLQDALPNIDLALPLVTPQDVPHGTEDLYAAEAMFNNTEKHWYCNCADAWQARHLIKMGAAVAGGTEDLREKPLISSYVFANSPLELGGDSVDSLLEFVQHKIPVALGSTSLSGATSPITLAGSLVVFNAEVLALNVISQVASKGTPVYYGGGPFVIDIRTGACGCASPETSLMKASAAQLAKYYGLLSFGNVAYTSSKTLDFHCGIENGLYSVMPILTGVNLLLFGGFLDMCSIGSLELLLLTNEALGAIKRMISGFEVNERTIALDAIKRAGIGGSFIQDKHTREHFREHWVPQIFYRETYENWERRGGKEIMEVAREKAKYILKTHEVQPLDRETQASIMSIIREAEERLLKKAELS